MTHGLIKATEQVDEIIADTFNLDMDTCRYCEGQGYIDHPEDRDLERECKACVGETVAEFRESDSGTNWGRDAEGEQIWISSRRIALLLDRAFTAGYGAAQNALDNGRADLNR